MRGRPQPPPPHSLTPPPHPAPGVVQVHSLSEQQLIDCDTAPPFKDAGCAGGEFEGGVHYIVENGGIDTEADYPYTGEDGVCDRRKERKAKAAGVDGFKRVPRRSPAALKAAVAKHPVAVAVCCGDFIDDWWVGGGGGVGGGVGGWMGG